MWKGQRTDSADELHELRSLSEAISDVQAVIWFDRDGMIIKANAKFCELMGYNASELTGKHHRTFVDPKSHNTDEYQGMWDSLRRGVTLTSDIERIRADGKPVQLTASYVPIKDANGSVQKIVKFASDISGKRESLDELASALHELLEGRLDVRLPAASHEDYQLLFERFNGTVQHLEEMIQSINGLSLTLAKDAADITGNAQDLASRGEAQAATLEETAASLEELSTAVAGTAENAQNAATSSQTASNNAKQGTQVVSDAISAMQEIKDGSSEIGKIIEVIDSISFQTNLLALNAGIEAARAGDAGRGFAVVASEIRALAQRTAEAAKDISDLIVSSNSNVSKGAQLVDQTGEALGHIVKQITSVVDNIEEISNATSEQSDGINSVTQATSQMDIATQQNASLAEQSARSAEKMAESAAKLRDFVASFDIGGGRSRQPIEGTFRRSA